MKKNILATLWIVGLFIFSPSLFAANCGLYVGAGAGYGELKTPGKNLFVASGPGTTNTWTQGGWSGRAFVGYNFSQFLGLEAGYARYARSRYAASIGGLESSIRYYERTADVVAKFYLPIGNNSPVNLYALGGYASVWEQLKYADAGIPVVYNYAEPIPGTNNQRRNRPIFGLGFAVAPIRCLTINAEATRIYKIGSPRTDFFAVPNADLVTLNFAYNIGQF